MTAAPKSPLLDTSNFAQMFLWFISSCEKINNLILNVSPFLIEN